MKVVKKYQNSGIITQDSADMQRAALWARMQQMLDSSRFVEIGTAPRSYESAKVKGLPWEWTDNIIPVEEAETPFDPVGQYTNRSNYVEVIPLVREFDFSKNKDNASYEKKKAVSQGINYILDYYNSPGFLWRLRNARYLSPEDFTITNFQGLENKPPIDVVVDYESDKDQPDAFYTGSIDDEHSISIGSDSLFDIYKGNWQQVGAHEIMHGVDEALKANIPQLVESGNNWSESFPIFKQENKINKLGLMDDPNITDELYREYLHNSQPVEAYADLGAFREALYRLGIYDSRDIVPFTREHLEAFKKTGEYARLLEYYDDEDIIWMMNNIAMNDTPEEQLFYLG